MNKPKIHICKETKDWIPVSLESISDMNPNSIVPNEFEYVDLASVTGTELLFHRKEIKSSAPSRAQRCAQKGDIFFQTVRPYQQNNYYFELDRSDFVFSTGYAQIRPKNHGLFLFSALQSPLFLKNVMKNCTGTGYPAINSNILKQLSLYISQDNEEASTIGDYFKSLDLHIIKSREAICKLLQLKQACLQLMFPQNGEAYPRIRFKGFSGNWNDGILGDYLTIRDDIAGSSYTKEDVLSVSGEYGIVNQISFQGRSFAGASIANYRVVSKGNVVYTKSPLKANPFGIIKTATKEEGIVSPLYAVYNTKENCCPNFVNAYFNSNHRLNLYLRTLVNKGAKNTLLISDHTALMGKVLFPDRDEQIAIAHFFTNIDRLITIWREEFIRFRRIKSACLNGMFISE